MGGKPLQLVETRLSPPTFTSQCRYRRVAYTHTHTSTKPERRAFSTPRKREADVGTSPPLLRFPPYLMSLHLRSSAFLPHAVFIPRCPFPNLTLIPFTASVHMCVCMRSRALPPPSQSVSAAFSVFYLCATVRVLAHASPSDPPPPHSTTLSHSPTLTCVLRLGAWSTPKSVSLIERLPHRLAQLLCQLQHL
jgi:hypothetical protein